MKDKQIIGVRAAVESADGHRRVDIKKCTRCKSTPHQSGCKMESADVMIFYTNDASDWNNYLMCCFQDLQVSSDHRRHHSTSGGFHVRQQCLDNLVFPVALTKTSFYRRAKVQLVILSPDFLEFVLKNDTAYLGHIFEPSRVLTLMCGVSEADVTQQHRNRLVSFDSWKRMTVVENDQAFVMSLLTAALETIQRPIEKPARDVSKAFRLYPPKARESNSKVIVELKSPLPEGSCQEVTVSLETETEIIPIDVKCPNLYTLKFDVPDRFFGFCQYVYVHVKCGSESLGMRPLKCESKMGELYHLLETVRTPMEFICQSLRISSGTPEDVDRILVKNFRKNLPKNGFPLIDLDTDTCKWKDSAEFPTFLHFAAKYGLQETCTALLDCPSAAAACRIRNVRGLGPIELAETEGYSCLANMIENFMRLSETAQMYSYMKSVTEGGCSADYENLGTVFTQSIEDADTLVSSSVFNEATDIVNNEDEEQRTPTNSDNTSQDLLENSRNSNITCSPSSAQPYSKSQQELLQLLDDFKREKCTIEEAESMFDSWQLRQKSHSSFKEKQEQLKAMRQRYDHMQKKCQQDGKKSALERFRAFLVRSRKSSSAGTRNVHVRSKPTVESGATPSCDVLSNSATNGRRPSSNLSNVSSRSSSSLSNRSSTMSGISVSSATDSGAQSDIGEESNVPLVSKMIENLQYMYTPNIRPSAVARSIFGTPTSTQPDQTDDQSITADKAFSTSFHMKRRNPMPFPRVIPTSTPTRTFSHKTSSISTTSIPNSPDYIAIGANGGKVASADILIKTPSRARLPALPHQTSNLDIDQTRSSSTSTSPSSSSLSSSFASIKDGYLCMDGSATTTIASSRPAHADIIDDDSAKYCNVIYGPDGVYMDMSNPATGIARNLLSPVNSRENFIKTGRHFYVNTGPAGLSASDSDFLDRCDSVPDVPPPAPPITINRRPLNLPPPLPPRNRVILPRAK